MDERWLNREWALSQVKGSVEFRELKFAPDTYQYCKDGVPYTGATLSWWEPGNLSSVAHFANGYANGISVGWYYDGKPRVYNEMTDDVCDGWHAEWREDGTVKEKFRCAHGRPIT